jgi:hypothetical protein
MRDLARVRIFGMACFTEGGTPAEGHLLQSSEYFWLQLRTRVVDYRTLPPPPQSAKSFVSVAHTGAGSVRVVRVANTSGRLLTRFKEHGDASTEDPERLRHRCLQQRTYPRAAAKLQKPSLAFWPTARGLAARAVSSRGRAQRVVNIVPARRPLTFAERLACGCSPSRRPIGASRCGRL